MDPIFIPLALILALMYGTRAGGRAVRANYRNRRDAWAKANQNAGGPRASGAALGSMAATVRYGPGAARTGFVTGAREGWQAGKDRAASWKPPPPPQRQPADPPEQTNPPPATAPVRLSTPKPKPAAQPVPMAKKPNPTKGPDPMSSGEIATAEQFLAAMQEIATDAVADLQDAQAEVARAESELKRIDLAVTSLKLVVMPDPVTSLVIKLLDPAKIRLDVAGQRVKAADQRRGLAQAAADEAAKHVQMMGKAAGAFYGNTGN